MKKLSPSMLLLGVMAMAISLNSCKGKMKDADIKTAVETALKSEPLSATTLVSVDKGVATISGECSDSACRINCESLTKAVKGVTSVINNCTVAAPTPPTPSPVSLTTELDEATQQKVKDAVKDIKGVTVEFSGDKAILSGEVTKADRMKIMQMLASAKVKSDVSKLMDKK